MRSTNRFAFIVLMYIFSNIPTEIIKAQMQIPEPSFIDNGKTIDSLKNVYNCESIEYNNWEDKKMIDSCLTVCLINSTKVPLGTDININVIQLKGVAAAINKVLTNPYGYKSIYIIFVKKYSQNGMAIKVHSAGMEILTREL